MSSVLSTVITEERGLCYQQISVFYEIFPSHFRCLSELKFSSTRDNQTRGCLLGNIQPYWVPAKPSRSRKTSCSSWFWSLPISVLIPHLHASWCCPVSPSFLEPLSNLITAADTTLFIVTSLYLSFGLSLTNMTICSLHFEIATERPYSAYFMLLWPQCHLNTLAPSQLDIGWASPFSVKLWPNSDPTWRLIVLTLITVSLKINSKWTTQFTPWNVWFCSSGLWLCFYNYYYTIPRWAIRNLESSKQNLKCSFAAIFFKSQHLFLCTF